MNRWHGSLGELGFDLRSRIDFGFDGHDLWLGSLLRLGLSGKECDLSLALPQDSYQLVALRMDLYLGTVALI